MGWRLDAEDDDKKRRGLSAVPVERPHSSERRLHDAFTSILALGIICFLREFAPLSRYSDGKVLLSNSQKEKLKQDQEKGEEVGKKKKSDTA